MPGFKGEGPDVDMNLPKAPMPTFYGIDGSILGESQVQEYPYPQQQQQSRSNLVIEKFWENNDSGSITYIEIEIYRIIKSQVPEQHVDNSNRNLKFKKPVNKTYWQNLCS